MIYAEILFSSKREQKPIGTIATVILKMSSRVVSIESDSNGFSLRFSNGVAGYSFTCEKERGISIKKLIRELHRNDRVQSETAETVFLGQHGEAKLPDETAATGLHPIAG